MSALRAWFSFKGRIGRQRWWIYYFLIPLVLSLLLTPILALVLGVAFFANIAFIARGGQERLNISFIDPLWSDWIWFGLALFLCYLPFIWVYTAGSIKRCHDLGLSWWWGVILGILLSGFLLSEFLPWLWYIDLIAYLTSFVVLGCLRGTPGPNRFGPDPLAPPDAANIALPPSPQ